MLRNIIIRLSTARAFWRVRTALLRLGFYTNRSMLGVLEKGSREFGDSSAIRAMTKEAFPQLLLAVLIAVFAQMANPYLSDLYKFFGWKTPDEGIYGTILATVSSVGAVFIGLYYTALTAVGSATYARLPQNIRSLLTHEKNGNAYMRFLAFLTFFSLTMLCLRVLGYPKVEAVVPIISLLAGIGIIAFVNLGKRAFDFFDPTSISDSTFLGLREAAKNSCAGRYKWNDPSFQNHSRQQAESFIKGIIALDGISSKDDASQSRMNLLYKLVWFLSQYEILKTRIPTDSYWYARVYEHPSWYHTNDSATSIAHQTGTSLSPLSSISRNWVEQRLTPLLIQSAPDFIISENYSSARGALDLSWQYLSILARNGRLKYAVELLEELGSKAIIATTEKAASPNSTNLEFLAIVEAVASAPIQLCLQFRKACESSSDAIDTINFSKISSQNYKQIYRGQLEVEVRERIEWLSERLSLEQEIEGSVISPDWYAKELIAIVQAEVFSVNVLALLRKTTSIYKKWFSLLQNENQDWLCAAILSRQLEFLNKCDDSLHVLMASWKRITASQKIPGLTWPKLLLEDEQKNIESSYRDLNMECAHLLPKLASSPRPKTFPDYHGQFLHLTGEQCLQALIAGDLGRFTSLFPLYFQGCLTSFDRIREETSSTGDHIRSVRIAAGAILDLVEISGYAMLMSLFHEEEAYWSHAKGVWDGYLEFPSEFPRTKFLAAILASVEVPMSIPMRGVLRTTWNQRISHALSALPKKTILRRGSFSTEEIVIHPDPLVRIFANSNFGHSMHDGKDIFIDLYLCDFPDLADANLPGWRDLKQELTREERQNE